MAVFCCKAIHMEYSGGGIDCWYTLGNSHAGLLESTLSSIQQDIADMKLVDAKNCEALKQQAHLGNECEKLPPKWAVNRDGCYTVRYAICTKAVNNRGLFRLILFSLVLWHLFYTHTHKVDDVANRLKSSSDFLIDISQGYITNQQLDHQYGDVRRGAGAADGTAEKQQYCRHAHRH